MPKPEPIPAQKIVEMCGGYEKAVDAIMALGRVMWDMALSQKAERRGGQPVEKQKGRKLPRRNKRELNRALLEQSLSEQSLSYATPELLPTLLRNLNAKGLCWAIDK